MKRRNFLSISFIISVFVLIAFNLPWLSRNKPLNPAGRVLRRRPVRKEPTKFSSTNSKCNKSKIKESKM